MRPALLLLTLLAFGCSQLRYSARTEMVPIEPAPTPSVQQAPPPPESTPSRPMSAARRRWRGLVISGSILAVVGGAFVLGGALGLRSQQAADQAADARCMAQQGLVCGLFDGLAELPSEAVLGLGVVSATAGVIVLGVGLTGRFDNDR